MEVLSCINQATWISFCTLPAMFPLPGDDLWDNQKATCVLLSPRLQLQLDPS